CGGSSRRGSAGAGSARRPRRVDRAPAAARYGPSAGSGTGSFTTKRSPRSFSSVSSARLTARCRLGLSLTIRIWLTRVSTTMRLAHIRAARRAATCALPSSALILWNRASGCSGSSLYAYTQRGSADGRGCGFVRCFPLDFPGKRTRDAPIDRRIPRGPRLVAQPRRWLGGRCLCATRAVIAVPFRTYAQGTSWYEGLLLTAWQA